MASRYGINGPVKQESICLMPPHPQPYRMLPPPQRADGYHVGTPYVQQPPPPNQGNNQVPPLRGMPSTGPPNQSSTPPNTDLKVPMQQQQTSMSIPYAPIPVRGPAHNLYPRAPQPTTQSSRMANHRQGQQHIYPAPYALMQQPVQYLNTPQFFNNTQRPQTGYVGPFPVLAGHPPYPYPPQQSPSAIYFTSSIIPRQQLSSANVPLNPAQPTLAPTNIQPLPQMMNTLPGKRRKNAIPIINPTTGKEISDTSDEDDSHPASGKSSARQTPQPPLQNTSKDVQVQFIRQVNEAIKVDELAMIDDYDTSPIIDHMGNLYTLSSQPVPPQRYDSIIHNSKLQVETKEFVPAALNSTTKETTPVVSAITDAVEVTITNKPKDRESPVKGRKQREQVTVIKELVVTKEIDDVILSEKVPTVVEEEKLKDSSIEGINAAEEPVTHSQNIPIKKEVSKSPVTTTPAVEEKKLEDETLPEVVPLSNADTIVSNVKAKQNSTKSKEAPKQTQQILPQSQPQTRPHVTSPVPALPKVIQQTPTVPITQPSKPNNKTNKLREINLKGALKAGTDMDAFNDNIQENNLTHTEYVNSDYVNNDNTTMLNNNEDVNKNNDAATIKQPVVESKPKSKFDVMGIVKDTPKPIKPVTVQPPVESQEEVNRASLANEKLVQAKNEANTKANADIIDTNPPETKLDLPYEEDQWSPLNPNGKKVYGLEFLMALRFDPKSRTKPEKIPVDVACDDKNGGRGNDMRYSTAGRQADFTPNFGNNAYANKNSQRGMVGKRKSQQGSSSSSIKAGGRPSVIRVSISVKEDVKLKEAENAWKPARFIDGENMTEDDKKTADLYKKVRGILNKLTPQNFSRLLDQIKALEIDTCERLQGVIDLVFEKAVDEPNFSVAYANLCKEVSEMKVPMNAPEKNENNDELPTKFVNFRKLIVSRCQMEFEKNSIDESARENKVKEIELCEDPEKKKEMLADLEEYDRKLRMKSVGNIRFIGELFKQNMLTIKIMVGCLQNLISNKDEESLECLCKLMSTIGKELESRDVDLSSQFVTMKEIVDKKHGKISSRVRFMIQDVIDLRLSKWVPRRQDFNPKTMDQIQKDAEKEQAMIQALNAVPITPRKDDRLMLGNSSSMHMNERKNRRNVGSDESGWTTQTRSSRGSQINVVPEKLKISTPLSDQPLGANGMFNNWSFGANVKPPVSNNIYSTLQNMSSESDKRTSSMNMRPPSKDHYTSKGPSLERNYRHSYDDGRGSRSGSQHRSRDTSSHHNTHSNSMSNMPMQSSYAPPTIAPASTARDQSAAVPPPSQMTPEEIQISLKAILEEYLAELDISECNNSLKSKFHPSELPNIVTQAYNIVLERNKLARFGTGQLFAKLIKIIALSVKDYCIGLTNFLTDASDLIIDIPKLWDYLAELIAPLLCENAISLNHLHKCCDGLCSQNYGVKFLIPLFNLVIQEQSPNFLHNLWKSSGLSLTNFMSQSEVESFIKNNHFEILLHADASHNYKPITVLSQQEIHSKLTAFFRAGTSFDDIVNWISANVGDGIKELPFIRTLATVCFEEAIVQNKLKPDILKNRFNLILRYVDAKPEFELQCLYAIQALIKKLEHPSGLLLTIFDKIYEENLFSYESLISWESSKDPSEQEGKGVAILQLTSFFTQLKEPEDDDSYGSSEETGG